MVVLAFHPAHSLSRLELVGVYSDLLLARRAAVMEGADKAVMESAYSEARIKDTPELSDIVRGRMPTAMELYRRQAFPGKEDGQLVLMEYP